MAIRRFLLSIAYHDVDVYLREPSPDSNILATIILKEGKGH
jgi:hypothetical protein